MILARPVAWMPKPSAIVARNAQPSAQEQFKKLGLTEALLVFLMLCGIWLPQSLLDELPKLDQVILLGVLGIVMFREGGRLVSRLAVVNGLMVLSLLILFTLISPVKEAGYGIFPYYLGCCMLLTLRLQTIRCSQLTPRIFVATNVAIILLGSFMVFQDPDVNRFVVDYYSVYGRDKTLFLTGLGKPILTFGTHSVAGFFYLLLIITNCIAAVKKRRPLFLLLAAIELCLLIALSSITSLVYSFCSLILLIWAIWKTLQTRFALSCGLVAALLFGGALLRESASGVEAGIRSQYLAAILFQGSGFSGRYGADGTVRGNLEKTEEFGLMPLGMAIGDKFMFGDSGIVEFFMRGSVVFLLAIYGGFAVFVMRNISGRKNRGYAVLLVLVFLTFEVAFVNLLLIRTLSIIPFFVLYLRHLMSNDTPAPGVARQLMSAVRL